MEEGQGEKGAGPSPPPTDSAAAEMSREAGAGLWTLHPTPGETQVLAVMVSVSFKDNINYKSDKIHWFLSSTSPVFPLIIQKKLFC